ncbi:MAG TPA: MFS transporter [Pseudonocardiaceae bacterium]|nr:MFS transporter [Pseudonocardiaceae bacterium]
MLAVLCVAQFVDVLGVTIAVVALPALGNRFQAPQSELQWVVSGYALLFGGLLIAAGRMGDRCGHRRTFVTGVAALAAGSLLSAVAPDLVAVIVGRAVQGLAAAFMVPAALAMLLARFPLGAGRHQALAIWTAAGAAGGAAGFLTGGLLVDAAGWRSVFLVNVPLCLAALAASPGLPVSRPAPSDRPTDLTGAALVTVGLIGLLAGITAVGPVARPAVLAGSGALLGVFAITERRSSNPLLPKELLRSEGFVRSLGVACVLTFTTTPASVLGALFLQDRLGHSAAVTGLMFAPFSLAVVVGSWLSRRASGRWGHRVTVTAGVIAVAVAMLVSTAAVTLASGVLLVLSLVLSGFGLGGASVAVSTVGTSAVIDADQGLASGLLNAAPQLGSAVGTAAIAAVAAVLTLANAYLIAVGVAVGGALVATTLPRREMARREASRAGQPS